MKKKSILGRVGVVAMALTLATTSMMSGTLARYATDRNMEATAVIAKWDPKVTASHATEGAVTTTTEKVTIDLAKTMNTGDSAVNSKYLASSVIAPGTKGSVTFTVDNLLADTWTMCEVYINEKTGYTFPQHLVVNIKDTSDPLATLKGTYQSATGKYQSPFYSSSQVLMLGTGGLGKPLLLANGKSKTYTLEWDWPLDVSDYSDAGEKEKEESSKVAYDENDYQDGKKVASASGGDASKFGFEMLFKMKQYSGTADGAEGTFTVVQ